VDLTEDWEPDLGPRTPPLLDMMSEELRSDVATLLLPTPPPAGFTDPILLELAAMAAALVLPPPLEAPPELPKVAGVLLPPPAEFAVSTSKAICYYNDDYVDSVVPVPAAFEDLKVEWGSIPEPMSLTQEGPVAPEGQVAPEGLDAQEGPPMLEQELAAMSIDSTEEDLGAAAPVGPHLSPPYSACHAQAGWSYTPSPLSGGSRRDTHALEDVVGQMGRIATHHMYAGRNLQMLHTLVEEASLNYMAADQGIRALCHSLGINFEDFGDMSVQMHHDCCPESPPK